MRLRAASNRGDELRSTAAEGFSLIELLIVLALMAVLLFLSVPVSVNFYRNQLVDDTGRNLKDALRRAQTNAVASRGDRPAGVKVLEASKTLVLFQGASYASRVVSEDESTEYPATVSISGTSTEAVFSRLYGTSTVSETWTVTNGGATLRIGINAQGNVEMQ